MDNSISYTLFLTLYYVYTKVLYWQFKMYIKVNGELLLDARTGMFGITLSRSNSYCLISFIPYPSLTLLILSSIAFENVSHEIFIHISNKLL